ncbi:MAG: hypothetical protein GKR97_02435 [Rhizobiaceae bacterium]|nr:hypothetical protein [Rhizobiaceae bacterium]
MSDQTASPADIQLFEGALPKALHQRLLSAMLAVGEEKPRGKSSYSTTFWYPDEQAPSNVAEEAVVALRDIAQPPSECIGAEWWLGRLPFGKKLSMHFDRDLSLSRKAGKQVFPILGSVYYLNDFPSSPTIITDQVPGPDGKSKSPTIAHLTTAAAAHSNNYVVFPGDRLHGVIPDSTKLHPGMKEGEEPSELRLTLLVNYWHCRPSEPICQDYDGSIYRALQNSAVNVAA